MCLSDILIVQDTSTLVCPFSIIHGLKLKVSSVLQLSEIRFSNLDHGTPMRAKFGAVPKVHDSHFRCLMGMSKLEIWNVRYTRYPFMI